MTLKYCTCRCSHTRQLTDTQQMWQSPIGKQAVPHWASMLRWIWSISECNLKIRDSRTQTPQRVTCYSGNVEGADLKNNSQSTTPIDPKVGTGGSHVCWPILPTWPSHFRKNQAPAYSVSDKGQHDWLKPKWCFNPIPWILLVGITHHKPLPQDMCHTHGWAQQKSLNEQSTNTWQTTWHSTLGGAGGVQM